MGSGVGGFIGSIGGLLGGLASSESSRGNARAAMYAANLQWQIANRIQAIEEELFALWRQEVRPMELTLNNEIQGLQPYRLQYATATARAITEVRRQFSVARRKQQECFDVHCVGAIVGSARDMSMGEAMAAGWASTLMMRAEDAMRRSIDHQQRQEKLGMIQYGHEAYFSTDQTAVAAGIADRLMRSASASASNQANAAGYMVTTGLQGLFKEGGLFSDKKNPAPALAPPARQQDPAPVAQRSQQDPQQDDPLAPLLKSLSAENALTINPDM